MRVREIKKPGFGVFKECNFGDSCLNRRGCSKGCQGDILVIGVEGIDEKRGR